MIAGKVMNPEQAKAEIKRLNRVRQIAWGDIEVLARKLVPDYHFLDFRVSTFWSCEKSPVGMCVFKLTDLGRETVCRYCGDPLERK